MIALILALSINISIPIDYYFEPKKPIGISKPVNRKHRRGK